jgi:hypothetical protein
MFLTIFESEREKFEEKTNKKNRKISFAVFDLFYMIISFQEMTKR